MAIYLLSSSCSLLILLVFYSLFLEKEKMPLFNRWYLICSVVSSLVIPFLPTGILNIFMESNQASYHFIESMSTDKSFQTTSTSGEKEIPYLTIIYLTITTIFLVRFAHNLYKNITATKRNPKIDFHEAKLVLMPNEIQPHSFFNSIFVHEEPYVNDSIDPLILSHELAHVRQRHSWDIIFIELIKSIFWFNPLLHFYKRAIQLNHEFLADEFALKKSDNNQHYQKLILSMIAKPNPVKLASHINFISTKKRLIMMKTKSRKNKNIILQAATVPLLLSLLILFGCQDMESSVLNTDKVDNLSSESSAQEDGRYYPEQWDEINSKGGLFFVEGKAVSFDEAKGFIKEHSPLGICYSKEPLATYIWDNSDGTTPPPPPPPAPPSLKELAKMDGTFFLDNKEISQKKAADIILNKLDGYTLSFHVDNKMIYLNTK